MHYQTRREPVDTVRLGLHKGDAAQIAVCTACKQEGGIADNTMA